MEEMGLTSKDERRKVDVVGPDEEVGMGSLHRMGV